jgi:hypothetical protein
METASGEALLAVLEIGSKVDWTWKGSRSGVTPSLDMIMSITTGARNAYVEKFRSLLTASRPGQ